MKRNFNSWTRRFFACVVCGVFAVSVVWAERVSVEQAAEIAARFTNDQPQLSKMHKAPRKASNMRLAHKALQNNSADAAFYVFNQESDKGFVIVSADDRTAEEVLGYSENGSFDAENINPNLQFWLDRYAEEITVLQTIDDSEFINNGARKAKQVTAIKNLLKNRNGVEITWDQLTPYNNLCPTDQRDNTTCYTGCVATAASQIMYKWEWPKQGTGSSSYTWYNCMDDKCTNYTSKTLSANYGNTTYDWDNMLPAYEGKSYTNAQANAVATLMSHAGIATRMGYGGEANNGSGAWTDNMAYGLINYFGYKVEKFITMYSKSNYQSAKGSSVAITSAEFSVTRDQFIEYFNADLEAGRPILMGGEDTKGGHEFVCCGRDANNKFYINWGWEGSGNGYYALSSLKPSGSSYNFSSNLDALIGLEPKEAGHPVVIYSTGCTITPSASYAANDVALTATIEPTDATYDFSGLSVQLGSTKLTENTHYTLSNDKKSLSIKGSAITGDYSLELTISAVWTKNRYKYELLGENSDPDADEGMLEKNAALNLTILPASGYTLSDAACWEVTMGGNALTYGTGFTYEGTTFTIASVTGDVEIYVFGGKQVTWIANGTTFATTLTSSDKYVLPTETPDNDCDGREFYGWCAEEGYESESTAPEIIKNGDAANKGNIFYAVFATKGEGGGTSSIEKATSIAVGDEVILVCESKNMELSSFSTSSTVYGIGTSYSGTPSGDYSFTVVAGSEANSFAFVRDGKYWNWTTGNSLNTATSLSANTSWAVSFSDGDASITNQTDASRKIQWNAGSPRFACYTSGQTAVQLYKKVSGGSSYSDFTTTCSAPCEGELTGITLNTENVKKVFTEGEAFSYDGLVVTALYDGCDNKTVKPTSVSTPNMNQTGEQTITVTYESKSAEYTINVTALPTYAIRFYNNGVQVGETQNVKQGQAAAKPATDPEACEGYTFVGWVASAISPETESAPTTVTNFTATKDQDYYAVYSRTEEGEGGSKNVTYTASNLYSDQETAETKEVEGVTFGYAKGGNTQNAPKYYSNGTSVRMYANNTLTISAESAITAIQFTYGTTTAGFTANVGALSGSSWTGNAESIVFTANGKHWIQAIVVTVGGGSSSTTYYTTAPDCSTPEPCELISISIYTEDVKKVFTEGETFSYDGLVVIANYSNCASKDVTPTSVSTPDLSTAGDKTVTVSYTENEITRQKTYSITVKEPNQYTIAFYDNGVQIGDAQVIIEGAQPEVPSAPEPACSAYTFVGWWTAELAANNTESKEWISDFTATQDQNYYAIYSKTEGSESGPTASVSFKDADKESTNDASLTAGKIREDIVETETGIDSYSGSKVFASPNGAKLGSSKANGQLDIKLSSSVTTKTITLNAKQYGSDTGSLSVTVNGGTAFGSAQMPSSEGGVLTFTASSEVEIGSVTIATSSKRAYVKSVTIGTGSTSTTYYSSTVSCGGGTDVENASVEQVAVKALMNGQIVIIRGDAVYSITGVRIQ